MSSNNNILKELANSLAINYYDNSLMSNGQNSKNINSRDLDHLEEVFNKDVWPSKQQITEAKLTRSIVILGAGATKSMFEDALLGREAIEEIEKELFFDSLAKIKVLSDTEVEKPLNKILNPSKEDIEVIKNIKNGIKTLKLIHEHYLEKKKKMQTVYKLNSDDFESKLSLLSEYFGEELIRKKLSSFYNKFRYKPSILTEILAHMFKNRVIDAIINFNFDESLDQALEEEMLGSDYHYVYSDGQIKGLSDMIIDNRLKIPIYIKPHGTISYKNSLKFTKESYFGLSSEIKQLLGDLVAGRVKEGVNSEKDTVQKINLILIGFDMQSIEFNDILESNLPEGSTIFHFSKENVSRIDYKKENNFFLNYTDKRKKLVQQAKNKSTPELVLYDRLKDELIKEGKKIELRGEQIYSKLAYCFVKVWEYVEDSFNHKFINYKPRGLNRHELVCELFYEIKNSNKSHQSGLFLENETYKYCQLRTYFEIIVALAKSKGIIDINRLMRERIGYFYDLYRSEAESKKKEIESIPKICEKLGLLPRYLISDALGMPNTVYSYNNKLPESVEDIKEFIDKLYNSLVNAFIKNNIELHFESKNESSNNKRVDRKNHIKFLLRELYYSYSNDISPRFFDKRNNLFEGVKSTNILHTNLALQAKDYDFFQISDWDLVLISTERGGALNSFEKSIFNKNKKACIIFSTLVDRKTVEKYSQKREHLILVEPKNYNSIINGNTINTSFTGILYSPFWLHDHHMSIFLKKDPEVNINNRVNNEDNVLKESGWKFAGAVYYVKYGLSTKISPLFFDATDLINGNIIVQKFMTDLFTATDKYSGVDDFTHNNMISNKESVQKAIVETLIHFRTQFE